MGGRMGVWVGGQRPVIGVRSFSYANGMEVPAAGIEKSNQCVASLRVVYLVIVSSLRGLQWASGASDKMSFNVETPSGFWLSSPAMDT